MKGFSSLILSIVIPTVTKYFVTKNFNFSDEIFRYCRLIKLAPKFPSIGPHFLDHNSDKIYFSSLDVIIFFIISDEIHISSLKLYF